MSIRNLFPFLFIIISLAGCKQDFDVTSSYKEIPVVYGLLDQQENTHYVRIQKGYLIKGNAYAAAGVADSIYYNDDLSVKLTPLLNGSPNGQTVTLQKVNGDQIGLPKDTGTFANSPNILYRFDDSNGPLDPSKIYKLEVTNTASGKVISAQTSLVQDFIISTPKYGNTMTLSNVNPREVIWAPAQNGTVYDLTVRFNYLEHDKISGFVKDTFVDVPLLRSYQQTVADATSNIIRIKFSANNLFSTLAKYIKVRDDVFRVVNIHKGMQFKFAVGGIDLANYLNSRIAQGGLTSNEALPPYTNINGGVGIFSSRYFKEEDSVLLSLSTLDSLANSDLTKSLNFVNHY